MKEDEHVHNLGVGNGLDYAAHSENNAYLYDANGIS